jgi:hypothetical protein
MNEDDDEEDEFDSDDDDGDEDGESKYPTAHAQVKAYSITHLRILIRVTEFRFVISQTPGKSSMDNPRSRRGSRNSRSTPRGTTPDKTGSVKDRIFRRFSKDSIEEPMRDSQWTRGSDSSCQSATKTPSDATGLLDKGKVWTEPQKSITFASESISPPPSASPSASPPSAAATLKVSNNLTAKYSDSHDSRRVKPDMLQGKSDGLRPLSYSPLFSILQIGWLMKRTKSKLGLGFTWKKR